MDPGVVSVLYVVLLGTALWSVPSNGNHQLSTQWRLPGATSAALLVVGLPTLFQLTVLPGLLDHLERDRAAIEGGQLWRLVTALVVQDGGWSGAAFNLAFRALVGTAAEHAWGRCRWLVLAVASGLGAELWGLLVAPMGAGTSVVNFGLAASLAVLGVRRAGPSRLFAVISLLVMVILLIVGNIHGGAAAIGAATGAVLAR